MAKNGIYKVFVDLGWYWREPFCLLDVQLISVFDDEIVLVSIQIGKLAFTFGIQR